MVDNDNKLTTPEAPPRVSVVRVRQSGAPLPFAGDTHAILNSTTVINPPGPGHKDRTGSDQDRYKDKIKPGKDKLGDIIKDNPIFGDNGKIKVPVDGAKEPRWRPGRDQNGGGGGNGNEAGEDEAPIDYVEMSYEEFLKLFFDGLELPFMLRKMLVMTEVVTHKRRGITNNGPKARRHKLETAKARLKRAKVLKNARPEEFVEDFEGQCQAVFEAYLYHAAALEGHDALVGEPTYQVLDDAEFCSNVFHAVAGGATTEEEFRLAVLLAAQMYASTAGHPADGEPGIPYKLNEVVQERIEAFVKEEIRKGNDIPGVDQVPFHKSDMRYGRIEERKEPDSKCVVFLLLDRSGSMDGDPLVIAKAFFLLNIIFLRAKYKTVEIVMIAHDAHAERIADERKFYQIAAGGGTVAVPAWKMTLDIAEAEFSSAGWNRYMFHATDGWLFDGDDAITKWWTTIVESPFNYCGYLEIVTGGFGDPNSWMSGGQALLKLKPAIKAHVGMARVNSMTDLPKAFREILDKDRVKS